jgi:hypothetical protein
LPTIVNDLYDPLKWYGTKNNDNSCCKA